MILPFPGRKSRSCRIFHVCELFLRGSLRRPFEARRECGIRIMTNYLARGDEVAIMPTANSPVADVLEIAAIVYIGRIFLQLADGRMYATIGGKGLFSNKGYAVAATDEHRAVLNAKASRPMPVA
jgi:hypothetical protein